MSSHLNTIKPLTRTNAGIRLTRAVQCLLYEFSESSEQEAVAGTLAKEIVFAFTEFNRTGNVAEFEHFLSTALKDSENA